MPDVAWVSVPAKIGDYATRWTVAQRALAARRRIRDFDAMDVSRRPDRGCMVSGGRSPRFAVNSQRRSAV
jgi:hypothetical protein